MSKQKENKSDRNKPANLEMGAVSLDKQKRLDSTYYEKQYPDMKFMWILDTDGSVDKYLRAGASIQADEIDDQIVGETHGYKSKNRQSYVSVIGGTDHGVPVEQILMKMPKDQYQKIVLGPKTQRNEDIRKAMGNGKASSDDRDGASLETYSPELPTGGTGFAQMAGNDGFNQLTNK